MPVAVPESFTSIPTLDWSLLNGSPDERARFIADLRHALVNVGFMYLRNTPIPQALVDEVISFIPRLFALPLESKKAISMLNSPHFLGYSIQGAEFTKGARDNREQFDIATYRDVDWREGDEDWKRLWGPSQWPREKELPGFKATHTDYLSRLSKLSVDFVALLEEALGLQKGVLDQFYDGDKENMLQRSKIVKYPSVDSLKAEDGNQGVGPHYDAGFLTFLLQASEQPGLQVQNRTGEWIDAPPVRGTFVVNIGKGLELVTQRVAIATTHRVLSPPKGSGPRYSVPFFQGISLGCRLRPVDVRKEILDLKHARGEEIATDAVNFSEYGRETSGQVQLIGRIKSHPDVGARHYPRLYKEIFPDGAPAFASAY